MLFKEIVEQIDLLNNVPVFYIDDNRCATVTYRKNNSNKDRGIYLPNGDIDNYYFCTQQNNPIEFKNFKTIIESDFVFNKFTFAVFNVLHELGHWTQYKEYIKNGHNDCEYVFNFERDRQELYINRYFESMHLEGISTDEFNEKYSLQYLKLKTEKYANHFAKEHMLAYCKEWTKRTT